MRNGKNPDQISLPRRVQNQVLEECLFPESQRDSASKPRVARNELPWVTGRAKSTTPTGLRPAVNVHRSRNPVGVVVFLIRCPRVARSSQPWALGRNPFGIGRLSKSDWSRRDRRRRTHEVIRLGLPWLWIPVIGSNAGTLRRRNATRWNRWSNSPCEYSPASYRRKTQHCQRTAIMTSTNDGQQCSIR